MDALYFRASSDRQTTENQFEDLLKIAEHDGSGRGWTRIRDLLAQVVVEEKRTTYAGVSRTIFRVNPEIADKLAAECIYVEQGRSGRKAARRRPLFEQMKRDAAQRRFDRLLVWKVSRLGRDMRTVISTVYELADLGITVLPVKSQTGPISSSMGKLLWAIQAWFAEFENDERSEAIRAGHRHARAQGRAIGRPPLVFRKDHARELRRQGRSWRQRTAVGCQHRQHQAGLPECP